MWASKLESLWASKFDSLWASKLDSLAATLNHFLLKKEDIYRRNSELKYVCSVIIFDFSDIFFLNSLKQ